MNGLFEPSDFKLVPGAKHGAGEPFGGPEEVVDHIKDGVAALEYHRPDPMQIDPDEIVPVAAILYRAVSKLRTNAYTEEARVLEAILPREGHDNLRTEDL